MNWRPLLCAVALAATATAVAAQEPEPPALRDSAPDPAAVRLVEVATGFTWPLYVTDAGDGSGRLFVVQQTGQIRILQDGQVLPEPFLDISAWISESARAAQGYSEQGLLGLAFDPDYAANGLFYVNYTDVAGDTVVAQYRVSPDDPNRADPNSAAVVLTQDQPNWNHNGGHLEFGPDGYLYIAFGDGGGQGDPNENAQNPGVWLGKILRIDVQDDASYTLPPDNPAAGNPALAPEVWALGLRNPWRFSFDSATGDLYIGDVGGSAWEEINVTPAGTAGGVNFGWDGWEGRHPLEGDVPEAGVTFPVAEYAHNMGNTVVGGYVYRGAALPDLHGAYFYGDWGSGVIWSLYPDAAGQWHSQVFLDTDMNISSFGLDAEGELLVVDYYRGAVYRFAPAA